MYRLFKGRTAAKAATGALVGLALCSCMSPYVAPRDLEQIDITEPTKPDSDAVSAPQTRQETAQEYAADRARELHEKLEELDGYDRRTGAVILGSSVAAIALGAYGAHADALLGASFIGTATYGAREYVPIQTRKRIYANGASAIRCAIAALRFKDLNDAIEGTNTSNITLLETLNDTVNIPQLDDKIRGLAVMLNGAANGGTNGEEPVVVARTKEAQESAKFFISAAEKVKQGDMLIAATDAILDSVTEQLIGAQLDPDGARNALTSSAETHASALRAAYEALEEAVSKAKEESEEVEKKANDLTLALDSNKQPSGAGANPAANATAAKATAAAAVTAVEKNTSNLKAVVSNATRVLEIVNLDSTCAVQPST